MLLNPDWIGYRFYRFEVIKGKPKKEGGEEVKLPPIQIMVNKAHFSYHFVILLLPRVDKMQA